MVPHHCWLTYQENIWLWKMRTIINHSFKYIQFYNKGCFFQFHPLWQHVDRPLVEVKPEVGHVVALPFKEIALRMRYDNGGDDGGGGGGGGIPTCKWNGSNFPINIPGNVDLLRLVMTIKITTISYFFTLSLPWSNLAGALAHLHMIMIILKIMILWSSWLQQWTFQDSIDDHALIINDDGMRHSVHGEDGVSICVYSAGQCERWLGWS